MERPVLLFEVIRLFLQAVKYSPPPAVISRRHLKLYFFIFMIDLCDPFRSNAPAQSHRICRMIFASWNLCTNNICMGRRWIGTLCKHLSQSFPNAPYCAVCLGARRPSKAQLSSHDLNTLCHVKKKKKQTFKRKKIKLLSAFPKPKSFFSSLFLSGRYLHRLVTSPENGNLAVWLTG